MGRDLVALQTEASENASCPYFLAASVIGPGQ